MRPTRRLRGNSPLGVTYTRSGHFLRSLDGYLINDQGMRLQGYLADSSGPLGTTVVDLAINPLVPPRPTRQIWIYANFQADSTIPPPWDNRSPASTSSFSTGLTIYDAARIAR